ncbi:hypothetical protein D9619_004369 [Psilocybe cf. subviscida]|uniref:Uncharacterized protein n=1 Tax=Psilocybe cf. subviscida TaxID=2480587 RepID=A0A8H5BQ46_9AGAR|nr:hypothetical protein D9619_004369 [Psilocybe cf. subviscida]
MAATTSSIHPPLSEDNNLALGGPEAKLTRKDTTRTVLPNLGYPLQSTRYPRGGAAQPTLSPVDASPPRLRELHVGSPPRKTRAHPPSRISAPTSNHVHAESSAGRSLGDWRGWSVHGALERMGSHVSMAAKTLKKWHGRFSRHPGRCSS